jgi:magnesium-protoporphyrin IX monomethyl ester (oxidative) cyclase
VYHLQPPTGVARLRYDRFSPYQMRPGDYGLKLEPSRAYRHVYPLPPESLMRLAYFFEDSSDRPHVHRAIQERPGIQRLQLAVLHWCELWNHSSPPTLRVTENSNGLDVVDTRPYAVERLYRLEEKEAAVYRFCDTARTPASIATSLPDSEEAVDKLVSRRLVLPLNGKLLSLGVGQG